MLRTNNRKRGVHNKPLLASVTRHVDVMVAMRWFVKYSIIVIYVAGEASAAEKKESAATLDRVKRQIYWLKLTYDQRLAFARKHNEYRKHVDPHATDMKFLVRKTNDL